MLRYLGALLCVGLCIFISRQDSLLVESIVLRLNLDNYASMVKIHMGSK